MVSMLSRETRTPLTLNNYVPKIKKYIEWVRSHPKMTSARGGGRFANADACVNLAYKRPNFTDVGGAKMATFCRCPSWMAPLPFNAQKVHVNGKNC